MRKKTKPVDQPKSVSYSRNPINYSEGMAEDQNGRFIQYLAEQHREDQMSSMQSKQSDLGNRLSEERKLRQSAERKAKSLQEKLDFANQERFGDRRQRITSKAKKSAEIRSV